MLLARSDVFEMLRDRKWELSSQIPALIPQPGLRLIRLI
jgi:hypothetical protein